MWLLYRFLLGTALLLATPWLLWGRQGHYRPTLAGRLVRDPRPRSAPGSIWIHAVSVGEVGVARTLIDHLPAQPPLLVTTVTPTGQRAAERLLGDRAEIAYLPIDLAGPIRRFLDRHDPGALILVEGDHWPLLLHELHRRGIPVGVANGRVGDRSYSRLLPRPSWVKHLYGNIERFAMQTEDDRQRLLGLGIEAERVATTGNLKFDTPLPARDPSLEATLDGLAAGRPVLVAGSTMEGEDDLVLDAFDRFGGGARGLLVIAPRHPERWSAVGELAAGRFRTQRRSQVTGDPCDVLILDSLGELAALYAVADGAFIGGTLVPTGGHNPIEPARWGTPVAAGPSMFNFREIAERFDDASAWERVPDAEGLAAAWSSWIEAPERARVLGDRARALVEENAGATDRTLDWLSPLLRRTTES